MPTRTPVTISAERTAERMPIGPATSDVSFSVSSTPSACVSLPGPEHRSSSRSRPRRARISSTPSSGSSARISTAAPTPSASQTALSSAWMPYER